VVQADFKIDEANKEITQCPMGENPYKTSYYEQTGMYRASFNKETCENCPLREQCGAKLQKKSAYVIISVKTVQRAEYMKKLSTEEYRALSKKRNAVEAIPSVLRRNIM